AGGPAGGVVAGEALGPGPGIGGGGLGHGGVLRVCGEAGTAKAAVEATRPAAASARQADVSLGMQQAPAMGVSSNRQRYHGGPCWSGPCGSGPWPRSRARRAPTTGVAGREMEIGRAHG